MDSISSILGDKDFTEPEEVGRLKDYIKSTYNSKSEIRVQPKGLVIIVTSSALAGTLRLNMPEIKRRLNIDVAISIRIR
jgi:hypothetical protein